MTQALRLFFLYMFLFIQQGYGQVVCFSCYGNSTTSGKFCSIDSLCTGSSCFFNIDPLGAWSSGCSTATAQSEIDCTILVTDYTECGCTGDFCNKFEDVNYTVHQKWPARSPFSTLNLVMPQGDMITCQECGNLTIDGIVKDIPCDELNLCQGNFCVTKRGQTPHSYCGSYWEGTSTANCFKKPGEDEQCVCPQQMCNAVLPTEKPTSLRPTTAQLTTLLTTILTVTPPSTVAADPGATTTKPLVKRCKNNIKFSPNAQAVSMGEKLKNIIMGGFGSNSRALQEFQENIDTHICAYSEE